MMVLNDSFEYLLVVVEDLFVELNMLVANKYLLLNYYKKQSVMMFDHYMMDNNMMLLVVDMLMNKDQYKNPIKMMKMNHVMDMMLDNNMMMVKNNMNPYLKTYRKYRTTEQLNHKNI
jgi:hypothetical protein